MEPGGEWLQRQVEQKLPDGGSSHSALTAGSSHKFPHQMPETGQSLWSQRQKEAMEEKDHLPVAATKDV